MASQVLIPARCQRTTYFMQLKFEQRGYALWHLVDCLLPPKSQGGWNKWFHQLGTPTQPSLVHISGQLVIDPIYPGCVHCNAINIFSRNICRCNACGNVTCLNDMLRQGTCPTCHIPFVLDGERLGNLRGIVASDHQQPPATTPVLAPRSVVVQEVPAGGPLLLPEPGERRW